MAVLLALLSLVVSPPTLASAADEPPANTFDALVTRSRELHLAERREWLLLGHYRSTCGGGWKSEVDDPVFFLSPEGKRNPDAELEATLLAFARSGPSEPDAQPTRCRFPARYAWLREQLSPDPALLPDVTCPDLDAWRKTLNVRGVTLVFTAAYLNNPASMFGHTLLRLDRPSASEGSELLSYVVNYAANPTSENPFVYTVAGLTGGFQGRYSSIPYYLKIREYGDTEYRDLWEYELALDERQLDRFVLHLWEIGPAYLDYFYFDENCSYQLLTLLDVADPSLHLADAFTGMVVPADTVRAVRAQPGFVRAVRYRPSRLVKMKALRATLAADEVRLADEIAGAASLEALASLESRTPEARARVLDAAYELARYRRGERDDKELLAAERRILVARGRTGVNSAPVAIDRPIPPDEGHGSWMAAIGGGHVARSRAFVALSLRPVLHDLVAPQGGYADGSQIEMASLTLRVPVTETPLPVVDRFDLFRAVSLTALDRWAPKVSWRFALGAERERQGGGDGNRFVTFATSGGPGIAFGNHRLRGFLFVDAAFNAGAAYRDRVRLGIGSSLGFTAQPFSWLRLFGEASYLYPVAGEPYPGWLPRDDGADFVLRGDLSLALHRNVEARIDVIRLRHVFEQTAGFRFYW